MKELFAYGVTRKCLLTYPLAKAVTLYLVSYNVIANSTLTPFTRSIIVALVSGALGIFGIIVGALINGRMNKDILEAADNNRHLAEKNQQLLNELQKMQVRQEDKVDKITATTDTIARTNPGDMA